ncbi:lipid II flippase MurJ [Streptomyces sp. NPDC059785]|uniref:lipid II flippase MurJ n=1 Tax=Streptomyces sp. NPDC059785 TaxID=3346945 RepID=UPI0036625EB8
MTVTPGRADGTAAAPPTRTDADADTSTSTSTSTNANTSANTGTRTGTGTRTNAAGSGPAASPRFLARATAVTIGLSLAGALLGLGRDQALAHLFGAGSDTDAFLVAWTVPEFAATLLIEDGLAFVLVPLFSRAVAGRAPGDDAVRRLVAATLPRLALAFAAVAALLIAGAPQVVAVLAPGLPEPGAAVACTRLTATCVLSFGLAGYASAALRAHRRFLAPAAIYVAYNTGIIATMFVLGGLWGVRAAALGVAVGGGLMVAAQVPSLWRELRRHSRSEDDDDRHRDTRPDAGPGTPDPGPGTPDAGPGTPDAGPATPGTDGPRRDAHPASAPKSATPRLDLLLIAAVLLFALCRQSQVLVERFLASSLPAGAISHLNYAQKVAQMPMVLSLMLCTVTFPVVAQAVAAGDTERARARVERDLALVSTAVLLGAAAVVACAPQLIQLLFQRGAFDARDTAATAAVMRVYALGLLGHTLVGAFVRAYFSTGRPTWYPVGAMAAGIAVTTALGVPATGRWGVCGIAAANAVGITVSALLLLAGLRRRGVPVRTRRVAAGIGAPVPAAVAAAAAGWWCAGLADSPVLGLLDGGAAVAAVFVPLARALGSRPFVSVPRPATGRLSDVRHR